MKEKLEKLIHGLAGQRKIYRFGSRCYLVIGKLNLMLIIKRDKDSEIFFD